MNFYGLVDVISEESGFYGRKEGAKELKKTEASIMDSLSSTFGKPGVAGALAFLIPGGLVIKLLPLLL